jgi:hypothetical protein
MRTLALAAVLVAAMGGVAAADTWTDPNGRFTFDKPAGWTVSVEHSQNYTYVIAGNANNECQFVAKPNPNSASSNPWDVRRTAAQDADGPFTEQSWVTLGNSISPIFPNNSAHFVSRSVDTSGFWPVQRAELQSPQRPVHAAIQLRPGMDLNAFCMTYDGAEPMDVYNRVLNSVGTANDAQLQAAITQHDADRGANQAAAAQQAPAQQQPTAQEPPPGERHGRRGAGAALNTPH